MKKRIMPLLMVLLLVMAITVPTASAVNSRVISGRPTLRISGDTAYCEVSVKTNSGFCQTARYGKMQPSLTESVRELEECNGT